MPQTEIATPSERFEGKYMKVNSLKVQRISIMGNNLYLNLG